MPRAAWLGIGACAGALCLGAVGGIAATLLGVAALLLACAVAASPWRPRARVLLPLALGVAAIGVRGVLGGGPTGPVPPAPSGDGPWIGLVETVGAPRDGARPATIRLDDPDGVLVAATLPWYPPVVPGDRVQLDGGIRPPPESEYGDYLHKIGASGTLRADSLEVLPATDSINRLLEGWRRLAAAGLQRALPEPEAGLAAGVLIGLRDLVDRDLAAAFTTAGASHVVAISGWNIAIVASTLGALAGSVRRRRRALLTTAGIVLYVAFVGPSPSVVRAAAMAGVALLAREVGRPGSAVAALGWACAALLLVDPAWIDDAGFRLSALATAGILAWGTGLTKRIAGPSPGRARRFVADVLGVSFAAQAATTPIVLLDFGRLSLVAPIVNLIVVPLVPAAMATGALALVVGVAAGFGLPGVVATLVGLPAWVLYATMVATVRIGAGLPLASLALDAPWDVLAAVLAAVLIGIGARRGEAILGWIRRASVSAIGRAQPRARPPAAAATGKQRGQPARPARAPRIAVLTLSAATISLALAFAYRPDGAIHVIVLDVGQGDGILVEGDRGGRMLVDGGPDPTRLLIALDERLPPWDRRIDVLVLTHPHEDHVAGLAPLLQRYRVGRVYEPGMIGPGPGYDAWAAIFAGGGPPRGRLSTGDRLTLDSIRFRVLWPDADRVPLHPPDGGTSINNVSIVLLGEAGGQRFLLAGDVEEGVDPELLKRGLPTLDLLKV
ncbi:MAG TPA: ComEC/Rec2 family competence protein, partial [Candidatus Limnocylindrales bacterium]|nr:ComEC/Rec2 family competence protein [Candidatus Limnocylindrales bacterium]